MKFIYQALAAGPLLASGYQVGAGGRPWIVTPVRMRGEGWRASSSGGCSPSNRRGMGDCGVDRAFEDLASELQDDRRRRRRERFQRNNNNKWIVDDEESIRKKQEWVNKAFDFADDMTSEFADKSPRGAQASKEALRQQKEWANKIFGVASDWAAGRSTVFGGGGVRSEVLQDDQEAFQVALDVPGVKPANMDVSVVMDDAEDRPTLVVNLKRELVGLNNKEDQDKTQSVQEYSKTFRLEPSSMIDKITASTSNTGILTITVPKDPEKVQAMMQKIPVVAVTDDEDSEASVDFEQDNDSISKVTLDLPGIKVSNIEITLTKNEDDANGRSSMSLNIRAERVLGKPQEDDTGGPRTKVTEKSYYVDPKTMDIEKIAATLNNGVLTVSAPRIKKTTTGSDPGNDGEDEMDQKKKNIPVKVMTAVEDEEDINKKSKDDDAKDESKA